MKFGTDVQGAEVTKRHVDALTCHVAPPAGQSYHLSSEISASLCTNSFWLLRSPRFTSGTENDISGFEWNESTNNC